MTDIESSPCNACASDDGKPTCARGTCGERRGYDIELADPCGVCKGGGREKCPFLRLQKPCLAKLAFDRIILAARIDAVTLHFASYDICPNPHYCECWPDSCETCREEQLSGYRQQATKQLEEESHAG